MTLPEPIDAAQPLAVWTDDTESYVAHSATDAQAMQKALLGEVPNPDGWHTVAPDRSLTIDMTDEGKAIVKATAAQWVKDTGRGFLCSTEY